MRNHFFIVLRAAVVLAVLAQSSKAQTTQGFSEPQAVAAFYRAGEVQSVELIVAQEDLDRMLAALPERIYVPATFQWRDVVKERVAVRFKGNSSSQPNQRHKRSFLIRFDEYEKDQRFLGMQRVSFDNGVQFGSLFSEPIITEILRDVGIPSHRCNFAKVFLNDEYQGVYVNVERIDETFLRHRLADDGNGILYKVDEGGPGCNLQYLGDDPKAYARAFEAKTDAAKKDRRQLIDFVKMINQSPPEEFEANIEKQFEIDAFLRVTAVMLYAGAFDQLTGWNPHNYYLYQKSGQRWQYLPWDIDVGFSETAFGHIQVLDDWHAAWPVPPSGPNPLMERIVTNPNLLARYRKIAATILQEHFEPKKLIGTLDAKHTLIKDYLANDPFPHRRATVPTDRSYDDVVGSMKVFIRKRYEKAARELENPGDRPKWGAKPSDQRRGMPPLIAAKIRKLQKAVGQREQQLQAVHRLMRKLGPLLEKQEFDASEEIIDRALELVGEAKTEGKITGNRPDDTGC